MVHTHLGTILFSMYWKKELNNLTNKCLELDIQFDGFQNILKW